MEQIKEHIESIQSILEHRSATRYNTACGLCNRVLTKDNTKPGIGFLCWTMFGEPPSPNLNPTLRLMHRRICLDCSGAAREQHKRNNIFIYENEPEIQDVIFLDMLPQLTEDSKRVFFDQLKFARENPAVHKTPDVGGQLIE